MKQKILSVMLRLCVVVAMNIKNRIISRLPL